MDNSIAQYSFASKCQLDAQLALDVAEHLSTAISERGEAYLAVSGGNTPKGSFQALSQADLDWSKVTITLVDDRWVDIHHHDSNERLVRDNLLINDAAAASFISLHTDDDDPYDACPEIAERLQGLPEFDVLILGMGLDGHTASLFPLTEELTLGLTSLAPCIPVTPIHARHQRISLTLHRILKSRQLILQLVGQDKKAVLDKAMEPGSVEDLPIRGVLHQDLTPLTIYCTD